MEVEKRHAWLQSTKRLEEKTNLFSRRCKDESFAAKVGFDEAEEKLHLARKIAHHVALRLGAKGQNRIPVLREWRSRRRTSH